ncbi:MAG: PulJ/GspJ family protein [Chitinivibrionales bacterium]
MMRKTNQASGFTLLEIMVALSLSSALILTVLIVWRNINTQMTTFGAQTLFESETGLIAENIMSELKRANRIISIQTDAVTFSSSKNDTVSISFSGEDLKRNGKAIQNTRKDLYITSFHVEWDDLNVDEESRRIHKLIRFAIRFEDLSGDTITQSRNVAVPYFSSQDESVTEDWLF